MLDFLALLIAGIIILPFKGISMIMDGDYFSGITVMLFGFMLWSF